jgi:hypothetical protein
MNMTTKSVLDALFPMLDAAAALRPSPGVRLLKHVPVQLPGEFYDAVVTELRALKRFDVPPEHAPLPLVFIPEVAYAFPEEGVGTLRLRRCPDNTFASEYCAVIQRSNTWAEIVAHDEADRAKANAVAVGDAG